MNQVALQSSIPNTEWDARARYASRVGAEYFLRTLCLVTATVGGNLLTAVILLAVMQSNVAHVDGGEEPLRGPGPPSDDERRPVSVAAISAGLGVPYETVRRNVTKLEKSGLCVRVPGGVIVPAHVLAGPEQQAILAANWTNLRRLCQRVERAGVFAGTPAVGAAL